MIRANKHRYKKLMIGMFLVFLTITSVAFGIILNILSIYGRIAEWSLEVPVDTSSFLDPNGEELEDAAYFYDYRFSNYHLMWDQVVGTKFENDSETYGYITYTNITKYYFSDNEALWGGTAYVSWTYKYLVAVNENNVTMRNYARNVLINLTSGLSMLMAVPNGGLGSDYRGILGRGYAPPDGNDTWDDIFDDEPKHFNGTGIYSDWRWRGYTSNDEYGGYYLFLAMALKYLSDIEPIYENVSLIVDQLCEYMLDNNFLGIHGTGSTTGVDQKPLLGNGGFWIAILLKMGAICFPEKYENLYLYYMANEFLYLHAHEGGLQETVANYYAYHFAYCICLGYLLLEPITSSIGRVFYSGFLESIWQYTRNHRNAWYNALFLMIAHENGLINDNTELLNLPEDVSTMHPVENISQIVADVGDQLTRYTNSHFPDLHYASPESIPEEYELFSPVSEFVEKYNFSPALQDLLGIDENDLFYNKPLTCDYLEADWFIWNDNPWNYDDIWCENLRREYPGISFTLPYWMMRYCGYFEEGTD
ncbi:MAG: hypothetical protein GF364_07155 [Candidatus Lokiarchaeota archaeon]|nr:hypothetical protein [Candidatus Lokiarchaeota archaeon]